MKQEYQSILQNGIEKKYLMLEEEIEKDIVRRIQKAGKITSAADWQIQRYMVLGHSTEDVEAIIWQAVDGDQEEVSRLYAEVIEQEYVRSKAIYEQVNAYFVSYEQNYELQQLTNAFIQQSNDELFNISRSLGFMVDIGGGRKAFTPLSEIYNGYLDNAITMMASGAFDYNTMIRRVVGEMTASGLRTVDYASGHSNRVDVAVRRALLTGMGQLTGQISRMNGQALGTDKYEVDWHPGARPDHAKWQGRVWTYQQLVDVCGLGSGPGLLGWNCRHTYYPFLDGISVRNYSDQWLEEMDRKEAQKISYRGKEYNTYEATQKQRRMETAMRAQREKAQLLKQGGADKDDILNARCKYQAMLDEYKEFSRKFKLPEQRERIYYDLRGRVAPSQSTYKKWQEKQTRKAVKRAAEKERKAERAMREKAENNRRTDMDKASGDGIIKSAGSKGALNDKNDPLYIKRDRHAEIYYEAVRNSKKDDIVRTISKNTEMPEAVISKVYDHVFVNEYELYGGHKKFDPDYDMAESFRRLREGKDIQKHDLILLKHEYLEYGLMKKLSLSYDEAHRLAESRYNYNEALRIFKEGGT